MIAETRKDPPVYLLIPTASNDSYGDPVDDWSNPQQVTLPGASLQRHSTDDKDVATGTTTQRVGTLIVTGPAQGVLSQVTNDSRIMQAGEVWRVNGDPNIKRGLLYGNTHLTAALTRTTTEAPNG